MSRIDRPPVTRFALELVASDKCPKCRSGELDTGYECNSCGYDALWLSSYLPRRQSEYEGERET